MGLLEKIAIVAVCVGIYLMIVQAFRYARQKKCKHSYDFEMRDDKHRYNQCSKCGHEIKIKI